MTACVTVQTNAVEGANSGRKNYTFGDLCRILKKEYIPPEESARMELRQAAHPGDPR